MRWRIFPNDLIYGISKKRLVQRMIAKVDPGGFEFPGGEFNVEWRECPRIKVHATNLLLCSQTFHRICHGGSCGLVTYSEQCNNACCHTSCHKYPPLKLDMISIFLQPFVSGPPR